MLLRLSGQVQQNQRGYLIHCSWWISPHGRHSFTAPILMIFDRLWTICYLDYGLFIKLIFELILIFCCGIKLINILVLNYGTKWFYPFLPLKHGHSEHFEHVRKICSFKSLEDTTMLEVVLPLKIAWSFLGCLQRIGSLAHIPSCSLGSYYPELCSPKLCAHKSKPGPLL